MSKKTIFMEAEKIFVSFKMQKELDRYLSSVFMGTWNLFLIYKIC